MSPSPAPSPFPAPHGRRRWWRCLLAAALLVVLVPPPDAHGGGARWQWPLPPPHEVLAPFEAPAHRYGPGHRGIDIAAGAGAEVRAVEAGTVHFSGMVAGRGVVSVRHADGLLSTFEPVDGAVDAGTAVVAGDVLGVLEQRPELGHCPGAGCLHLGARRGEDYLDPMLLLGGRGPSVLLPWGGATTEAAQRPAPVESARMLGEGLGALAREVPARTSTPVRAGARAAGACAAGAHAAGARAAQARGCA